MSEKPKHSPGQGIASPGMPLPNRKGSGITLVESLVVIAIVAVLALVAFAVSGRVMDGARGSTAVTNLRQLSLANISYATENGARIVGPGNGHGELLSFPIDPLKFNPGN
jgi:prepilin-type N-terminal cleavage/methylation domain-containing protein